MSIRCVVVDFDGTFTDVAVEALPFEPAFMASVADLLGRDVRDEWARERSAIEKTPEQFGWVYDGKVVAPATADPYLLCTATVQAVLDRAALLRNPVNRTEVTQALYGLAYARTITAFKPEAKEALDALLATGLPVYVVTNSRTDAVARKLDQLGLAARAKLSVRGEAKKFWVTDPQPGDAVFARVPEMERAEGLVRPVFLRRGKYYEVLRQIWSETSASPEETIVCGDIYELDLALPAALGARVVLVERDNTLEYERAGTKRARGAVIRQLNELLTHLD
jgi:FMN phosphatase YigB (HAD superfamily)